MLVESEIAGAYRGLILAAGEDPGRDGLIETPARAARAWKELTSGYSADPKLTTFPAEGADQIVALRDISFFSLCEHHLLPFYGHAHIAYLPGDRILGLSKFARVVDAFARRLQVQERLTQEIADRLEEALAPAGLLVVLEAEHLCMAMRGVQRIGSRTRTSFASGVFRTTPEARQEAFSLLGLRTGGT
jgi:GTP cyclohydrolase I